MKKIFLFLGVITLTFNSCSDYLDINYNPNSPAEANLTPSLIFPGAEMNLCNQYGNFLRITGGYFAQQYAHNFGTSNYVNYSQWEMSPTRSNRNYSQLSTLCLKNMEAVRNMATEEEDWGTYLAATVIRAFTYQVLVDSYGEIPYTEALNVAILSPKYDDGQKIYEGILSEINEALAKASPTSPVCKNLLFGTSTANEWIQFANALKLKILMRMSDAKDVKNELSALISEGNFPKEDVNWGGKDFWQNANGSANPFFQEEFSTSFGSNQVNVIVNIALVGTMQASNDARLEAAFYSNDDDEYNGGVSGTNFAGSGGSLGSGNWCRPRVVYNTPVFLITLSEIEFFLAEYYAKYGGGNAEEHYKAAVEASFNTLGVDGADAVLAAFPWDSNNYKRVIGIQKWVALGCVNPFEAWCELRRLKFPDFGTITGDHLYNILTYAYTPSVYQPNKLYMPIERNAYLNANTVLQRFTYPENSSSRNSNTPEEKPSDCNKPIFWVK